MPIFALSYSVMNNFIIIFFFLLLGFSIKYVKGFPTHIYTYINKVVLYICLPAITLFYIPKIKWSPDLLFPISAAWICFFAAILFFHLLGKSFGWSNKLIGCLILTAGLSNTSFVGFPVIEALFDKKGLETAVLVDQPGTFVVFSTLGVVVAAFYSNGNPNVWNILKKIIAFPPFLTFTGACLLNVFNYELSETIQSWLLKIGSLVTPLALFSVGLQLKFDSKSKHFKFLLLGLLFSFVLAPLLIFIVYVFIFNQHSEAIKITIMEMAMAPMITGAIMASTYGLKPKLSSMMIGYGIPLSFCTLAIWYLILNFI
jgi:predicted permease